MAETRERASSDRVNPDLLLGRSKTVLVPDTWDPVERIEHITAVVERDFLYLGLLTREIELFQRQRMMKAPGFLELFEPLARCDPHARATGEQLFVGRH
jgi:hypothetical protein